MDHFWPLIRHIGICKDLSKKRGFLDLTCRLVYPMIDLIESTSVEELNQLPYWNAEERVLTAEPAGESNMNLVLRIGTNQRSLILKQSKPYVRKYPQIPAPIERIAVEHRFLELIGGNHFLASLAPKVIQFDGSQHILISEDLGKGADFSGIYSGKKHFKTEEIKSLMQFLNELHGLKVPEFPDNLALRKLNHEHIFKLPFLEENGFDLDQVQVGLQGLSLIYKRDAALKAALENLGQRYLSQGSCLIHGDFYPGSWLEVPTGPKVIDPEFAFLGDPEFDLGVFLAHLDLALVPESIQSSALEAYTRPMDSKLIQGYRGAEILRRLLGLAQVPLNMTLSQKESLLSLARNFILFPQ